MMFEQVSANSASPLSTTSDIVTTLPVVALPGLNDDLVHSQPSLGLPGSSNPVTQFSPQDLATAQALNPGSRNGTPFDKFRNTIGGKDSQGKADKQDFYKFSGGSTMSVALTGLKHNTDIQLLNSSGLVMAQSTSSGSNSEIITLSGMDSDTYYIRVYQDDPEETPYDVQASNNLIPDLLVAEQKINNLSGTKTFSNKGISNLNTSDIYQFSLNTTSNVTLNLSGVLVNQDTIGMRVIRDRNNNGVLDNEVILDAIDPTQTLNLQGLGAGTYLVQIFQNPSQSSSGNISYNLSLTAKAGAAIAPEPNNSTAQAFDVGTLDGLRSFHFTGAISTRSSDLDKVDFYKFTIPSGSSASTLKVNLTGLSANLDLRLLDSSGKVLMTSSKSGNASEAIRYPDPHASLSAGTYYVEVFAASSTSFITDYKLELSL